MKILFKGKDGGKDSFVTGYWLIESKMLGSIVLLCFDKGSHEAFHTHAFNAISWVLTGELREVIKDGLETNSLTPSFKPVYTSRERFHRVFGIADKTWAISFRGPWKNTWKEYLPISQKDIILTHGRKQINTGEDYATI
jgi:hypothetical protein